MARRPKKLVRLKTHWSIKPLYVIATEGEVTEKEYFNGLFQKKNIRMPILPTKKGDSSPDKVLKRLNTYRNKYNTSPEELWLVIDRDNWSESVLKKISEECTKKNYNLIVSNPCFELWLLLHQKNPKHPSTTTDCIKELKNLIPNYTKSKYSLNEIAQNVNDAIKHAKDLDRGKDIQGAPSTKVFKLVEKLSGEST